MRSKIKKRIADILLTAIIFAAALIFIFPTVLTVTNSFMTSSEISANYGRMTDNIKGKKDIFISEDLNLKLIPDKVTFSQYSSALFKNPDYLMKFWNSVILTLPITVLQIVIALSAAYGFTRYPGKFKSLLFFVYIILMMMPYQVTLVPNFLVADKLGLLETRWSVILPGIFSTFSVFLFTKAMKRIPVTYIEAAKLDGAGESRILTDIFIPLCKGEIISVTMLIFIDCWNMAEQPLVMMSGEKGRSLQPLSVFLSRINTEDIGIAFAVGVVYMIPSVLLFIYGEDHLVNGIVCSGGIKG